MKKVFIILLIIASFFGTAYGQIIKGNWMTGGDAAFSRSSSHSPLGSTHKTNISVSPDVGYFIINKLALGADAAFEYTNYKAPDLPKTAQHSFIFGPFIRYYFLPVDHVVNLLGETSFQHIIFKPGNSSANRYSILAGPTAFFNSSVAIEATVGFSSLIAKNSTTHSIVFNIGLQIYLEKY